MKKLIIGALALAILAGCKKGENDPGISFRSRDARVMGEWKIASWESIETSTIGTPVTSTSIETEKFDGSRYTRSVVVNGTVSPQNPDNNVYTSKLTIEERGKVSYVETQTSPQGVLTTINETGTWYWANSHKNKSTLIIDLPGQGNIFSGGEFELDQLKNKEIISKSEFNFSDKSTGQAAASDRETTMTMTMTWTQE